MKIRVTATGANSIRQQARQESEQRDHIGHSQTSNFRKVTASDKSANTRPALPTGTHDHAESVIILLYVRKYLNRTVDTDQPKSSPTQHQLITGIDCDLLLFDKRMLCACSSSQYPPPEQRLLVANLRAKLI